MGEERRRYKRIEIFPLTVTLESQNNILYGFITDLSLSGLQLCIHDNIENITDFSIKIPLPKQLEVENLTIDANQVWINSMSNLAYNEIGCQFKNVEIEQKSKLEELITLLESEVDNDVAVPPNIEVEID